MTSTGKVFAAESGVDPDHLGNHSFVINLQNAGIPRSVFYHDHYGWYAKVREFRAERTIENVWFFDEAHTMFSRLVTNRHPFGH